MVERRTWNRRRFLVVAAAVLSACVGGWIALPSIRARAEPLPDRLSDGEFWALVSGFSELGGTFRSDNLLSNEAWFQYVVPDLAKTAKPGRVYLGVGPEQNFTYIAAVRPSMAFIVDIRRGNRDLHLMYKALFELSEDRVEFVSRLFSRKRPAGLGATSSAADIFTAFARVEPTEPLYQENLAAIRRQLVDIHGFRLSDDEIRGVEYVYYVFFMFDPAIRYSSTGGFGGTFQPTYADLMSAEDGDARQHGYLSSEDRFAFLKRLESRNLLLPVVGNFVGPKAIRAVATYLRKTDAKVSAFYVLNVEQFLRQASTWDTFCASAARLPIDESSTFIRSVRGGRYGRGMGLNSELGSMMADPKECQTGNR